MADWWNPISYDWGGLGHGLQHNVVSEGLNNGWRAVADSEIGRQLASGAVGAGTGLATLNPGLGIAAYGATNAILQENSREHGNRPGMAGANAVSPTSAPSNPYDQNNPALQQMRQGLQDRNNLTFDAGRSGLRGMLAARGMLGSGQEGAALNGYEANRGLAAANIDTSLATNNYNRAADWADRNYSRQIAERQYKDQQDAAFWGGLGNAALGVGSLAVGAYNADPKRFSDTTNSVWNSVNQAFKPKYYPLTPSPTWGMQ